MWERLRRFKSLDPRAQRIFLRAVLLLPLISMSLRLRGFRATQFSLQRFLRSPEQVTDHGGPCEAGAHQRVVKETARMTEAAVRQVWHGSTCLEKSLASWWLLGRQGVPAVVRIGARMNSAKFEAHAWVECEGLAVNEPEEPHRHYAAFDAEFSSLPREAR